MSLSWDSVEWLEINYKTDNGLPGFYRAGAYGPSSRAEAEADYINSVKKCLPSRDESLQTWAFNMVESEFGVLKKTTSTNYWVSQSIHENVVAELYQFENTFQTTYNGQPQMNNISTRQTQRRRTEIVEVDNILSEELGQSLGSIIRTRAANTFIDENTDNKSLYFKCIGENNIIDISNNSPGSQLYGFTEQQQNLIKDHLKSKDIVYEDMSNDALKSIISNVRDRRKTKDITSQLYRYAADESVEKQIIADIYLHCLNLITRSPQLFEIDELKVMSENDYIVKFWGRLIELTFENTSLYPHWGDTVSEVCKRNNSKMKMDLRVLCNAMTNSNEKDDVSLGEFAKNVTNGKLYKDRTKLATHAKMILNELVESVGNNDDIRVCMIQVMGMQAELLSLRLFANGLYILESHGYLNIPTTIITFSTQMNDLIDRLSLFKELSLLAKTVSDVARVKLLAGKKDMSRLTTEREVSTSDVQWTRKLWSLPNSDSKE